MRDTGICGSDRRFGKAVWMLFFAGPCLLGLGAFAGCSRRQPAPSNASALSDELLAEQESQRKRAHGLRLQEKAASAENMVLVPAGRYRSGDDVIRKCPEQVFETAGFYIDIYEVTNAAYYDFTVATDHPLPMGWIRELEDGTYKEGIPPGMQNHPVTMISYFDAEAYTKWAGKRLPTSPEWEAAARGLDGLKYPWGNRFVEGHSNDKSAEQGTTCPVDEYPVGKSPFGCFNMAGNVQEWTQTSYSSAPGREERLVKGGSFLDSYFEVQAALWKPIRPAVDGWNDIGFRCVKDIE